MDTQLIENFKTELTKRRSYELLYFMNLFRLFSLDRVSFVTTCLMLSIIIYAGNCRFGHIYRGNSAQSRLRTRNSRPGTRDPKTQDQRPKIPRPKTSGAETQDLGPRTLRGPGPEPKNTGPKNLRLRTQNPRSQTQP